MEGGSSANLPAGITGIVADIWTLVGSFITFANSNVVVWVPVGFAIARATVSLFRKAVSFGGGRRR